MIVLIIRALSGYFPTLWYIIIYITFNVMLNAANLKHSVADYEPYDIRIATLA